MLDSHPFMRRNGVRVVTEFLAGSEVKQYSLWMEIPVRMFVHTCGQHILQCTVPCWSVQYGHQIAGVKALSESCVCPGACIYVGRHVIRTVVLGQSE